MNQDWSNEEVKLIVEDYFKMLHLELSHHHFNKTAHRNALVPFLTNRSKGSIEFKHQNISAALIQMGLPFIKGYKPRFNYQQILSKEIIEYIDRNKFVLENEFEKFSTDPIIPKLQEEINYENILNEDPVTSDLIDDEPTFRPIKTNYLEKEQNNRSLGEAGEDLIMKYEKWRLINSGKDGLAEKIEWISRDHGDGAGFDILSKNTNGTDRYIEVKTTKLSKETPIFLTRTELSFASLKEKEFYLYRVYDFESFPKFFIKTGKYESFCRLKPQVYKGFF